MKTSKFKLKLQANSFVKDRKHSLITLHTLYEFIDYMYGHQDVRGMFDLEKQDDLKDAQFYIKELQNMIDLSKRYE